jgi:hypothetical protein
MLFLDEPADRRTAALALARGGVLGYGFANFYGVTALPDAASVRAVNLLKGRPADQVGSITTTPSRLADAFDWSQLPVGLSRSHALAVMDAMLALGPFGFRGPAAAELPPHLAQCDGGVLTTQVITPGYACPSNAFVGLALQLVNADFLFITSANRSRNATGAAEEPAHYTASGLLQDFGDFPEFVLLQHRDEMEARSRYPAFAPMSTSILAFHRLATAPSGVPALVLERHGSLSVDAVRQVLHPLGLDVALGPRGRTRLPQHREVTTTDRR